MSNVSTIEFTTPRAADIHMLQTVVTQCIRETAKDVGTQQIQAFFNGYKDSIDSMKKAA